MSEDLSYASRRFMDAEDHSDPRAIVTAIQHHHGWSSVDMFIGGIQDGIGWTIKDKEDVSKVIRCLSAMEEELAKLRKEVSQIKVQIEEKS